PLSVYAFHVVQSTQGVTVIVYRPGRRFRQTDQYASELITSPWLIVLRARHVASLIESLMNRTEPSPIRTLTPPGCRLLDPANASRSNAFVPSRLHGSRMTGSLTQKIVMFNQSARCRFR